MRSVAEIIRILSARERRAGRRLNRDNAPLAPAAQLQTKKRKGEAREILERLIGQAGDWAPLDKYLIEYLVEPSMRATVMASSLAATLELVREGALEVHQQSAFAPIYLRKRDEAALAAVNSSTAMPRATE